MYCWTQTLVSPRLVVFHFTNEYLDIILMGVSFELRSVIFCGIFTRIFYIFIEHSSYTDLHRAQFY